MQTFTNHTQNLALDELGDIEVIGFAHDAERPMCVRVQLEAHVFALEAHAAAGARAFAISSASISSGVTESSVASAIRWK